MLKKKLRTLAEAAMFFPKPPSPQTIWRWRTRGVNGVLLECIKCGGRWYTTIEAIENFLAAQTLAANSQTKRIECHVKRDPRTLDRLREAGLLSRDDAAIEDAAN